MKTHTQLSISVLKHCRIHLNLIIHQIQDYQIQTDYLPLHSVRHHCRHIQRKDQKCHSETLCPSFLSVLLQLLSHFYRPDANIIKTYTKITTNTFILNRKLPSGAVFVFRSIFELKSMAANAERASIPFHPKLSFLLQYLSIREFKLSRSDVCKNS